MKFILFLILIASVPAEAISTSLRVGIEHTEQYLLRLQNKRVAIVTHQASQVNGLHSVDFLREHGVNLIRVFSPEHGFRGNHEAGESVTNLVDYESGFTIVSLYGKKKKPTPEDLKEIDIVLFDLQDVGCRFYTYLSTLHYVMEACGELNIPLLVMDRPNPNAFYVDGPVLRPAQRSFVGMHPVPIVYGMTIGEYARMINGEGWLAGGIRCDLTVIPCSGWQRSQSLPLLVPPSPNLPDSVSVRLYPTTCLFEGTVINEGRGTLRPFQLFGHPQLADMPYHYIPRAITGMSQWPKQLGKTCHGMDLADRYDEVRRRGRLQIEWIIQALNAYKGTTPFFTDFFDLLAGTPQLRQDLISGKSADEIRASWTPDLEQFKRIRTKYLLYP